MIKVCMFSKYHDEIVDFLTMNSIEYKSEECLLRCDLCHRVPFVKIDTNFIYEEDLNKLFTTIKESL